MKPIDVNQSGTDDCCSIDCECGQGDDISVCGGLVKRCPSCGKGYRTDLIVYQYEPDERDAEYEEWEESHRRSEEWYALSDKIRKARYLFEAMPNNKKFEEELAALREEEEKWLEDNYGERTRKALNE